MSAGLSALIRIGAELENEFDSIEVIAIERSATVPVDDYTMEVCGRFLFYTVALYGPEVRLSAQPMDAGDPPDLLLRAADNENGWDTTRRLVASLERNQVKSLRRPIESGEPGDPDAWVIA
jgi:hypothetical protein